MSNRAGPLPGLASVARMMMERDLAALRGAMAARDELAARIARLAAETQAAQQSADAPPLVAARFAGWAEAKRTDLQAGLAIARQQVADRHAAASLAFGRHQSLVAMIEAARRRQALERLRRGGPG